MPFNTKHSAAIDGKVGARECYRRKCAILWQSLLPLPPATEDHEAFGKMIHASKTHRACWKAPFCRIGLGVVGVQFIFCLGSPGRSS